MSLEGSLAVNRFGLGARPGEVARASENPKAWLTGQIAPADQPLAADGTPFTDADLQLKTAELTAWQSDLPAADPGNKRIGALSLEGLQRYSQLLADAGVTKTVIAASDVVSEDYVAFANDFDHDAFVKRAKSMH